MQQVDKRKSMTTDTDRASYFLFIKFHTWNTILRIRKTDIKLSCETEQIFAISNEVGNNQNGNSI